MNDNIIKVESDFDNIFQEGKFIAVRKYNGYFVDLYLWNDEFYEVYFHISSNQIDRIEKLYDENNLNYYIDYMNQLNKHENA